MTLPEILSSGPALGTAAIAVVAALYKSVRALFDFHEYLRKRHIAYLDFLGSESKGNERLAAFLDSVKHAHIFASVFGISVSPRTAGAIMRLYETNVVSPAELRQSRFYLRLTDNGDVEVRPGRGGNLLAVFVSVVVLGMGAYVSALVLQLLAARQPASIPVAVVLSIVFLAFGMFLMRDVVEVVVAHRVGSRLEKYRAATNPELKPRELAPVDVEVGPTPSASATPIV